MRTKLLLLVALGACGGNWEYKTLSIKGAESDDRGKFAANRFVLSDEALNALGAEGWELVGVYDRTETVHPNFGNGDYVTGIQPNVRTSELDFVFKRRK